MATRSGGFDVPPVVKPGTVTPVGLVRTWPHLKPYNPACRYEYRSLAQGKMQQRSQPNVEKRDKE